VNFMNNQMKRRKIDIDPEVLRKWLLEEGMTFKDVAMKFKVSEERVRQIAKKYRISRSQRTPKWYAKRWGNELLSDPNYLIKVKDEIFSKNKAAGFETLAKILLPQKHPSVLKAQIKRLGLNLEGFTRKRSSKIQLKCLVCGKEIWRYRYPFETRGQKMAFCSKKCQGKWFGRQNLGKKKNLEKKKRIYFREKIDVEKLKEDLQNKGKTCKDVAKEFGVSIQRVILFCKENRIPYKKRTPLWYAFRRGTPELGEKSYFIEHKEEILKVGLSNFARKMGWSYDSLKKQLKRLGLDLKEFKKRSGKTIDVNCAFCGKVISRPLHRYKKYQKFFCDRKCKAGWMRKFQKK
jgi:transposase/endogenous inhibitor of DNA gyrase (YacG/DUF329 family)